MEFIVIMIFLCIHFYQEIIILNSFFKGKYCVENVRSYYEPMIKPTELDNHYFWSNFVISTYEKRNKRSIRHGIETIETKSKKRYIDLSSYDIPKTFKEKMLNNMVFPEVGRHIFDCAFKFSQSTLISPDIKGGELVK